MIGPERQCAAPRPVLKGAPQSTNIDEANEVRIFLATVRISIVFCTSKVTVPQSINVWGRNGRTV